ncbi:MAG: hypothetical protein JWN94_2376 [Betaproteobacteria bacterium]|nr:hypothetical protein [Betaproteobacteria bacterium]
MSELAALQQRISIALRDRDSDAAAVPLIAANAGSARARLAIYRANISTNAAGALAAIYPIVHKLVGADFFGGLVHAYCNAHPSASGDLNELGEHLADFVRTFPPAIELPYLSDVARLEWCVHRAHYSADHPPLDVRALRALGEDAYSRLILRLHPAVSLIESGYPLYRIWQVHQDDYEGDIAVDLAGGADAVVVYRPQFRVAVAKLSPAEAAFLRATARDTFLATALEAALSVSSEFDLASSLSKWTAANIVVGLHLGDEPE